ncbi:hypothetical protein VV02_23775 [Luteipulveratus mongoliensis]|uniref:histidine kinase n=1 Tax=Luteipulveratus mongoliensis TaxID=571913 RepID=A0A0K1JRT0_9MICO|nr:hypothetical protein VV02_23775 [Luteipulveratus mongoliensis]
MRTRLAVVAAVSVALAIALVASAGYILFARELHHQVDLNLTRDANRIRLQVKQNGWDPSLAADCRWQGTPACARVVRAAPSAGGAAAMPVPTQAREVATGQRPRYLADVRSEHGQLRMLVLPLRAGEAVQVAVPIDPVEDSLARIRRLLAIIGLGGVGLACALGYLVSRISLRPVARIAAVSKEVATTRDPGHRIPVRGRDALAQLSENFNTMLAALQESLAAQRNLVADASHELRTPLTALRSDISLLTLAEPLAAAQQERVLRRIDSQLVELTDLITDLIELARGDLSSSDLHDVRLDEVVEHSLASARRRWPSLIFEAELSPTVISGAPDRLGRAVTNLLDNAAKFSPAAGTVTIRLTENDLRVRDRGPGIPAEDLPRVFDRFYRSDTARQTPGSGLGLAIVAQVVHAHGTQIEIRSPEDGGVEVIWRL